MIGDINGLFIYLYFLNKYKQIMCQIMNRLEEIEKEIIRYNEIIDNKMLSFDFQKCKSFGEYENYCKKERIILNELYNEKRMLMDYTLSDIPDYGDIMYLKDFLEDVKCGNFIDYDGSGNYLLGDKMTNISIYPSDKKHRTEFTEIVWFNR